MAIINSPPASAVDTQDAKGMLLPPSEGWRNFFNAVFNVCNAMTMSGATAKRPTVLLWNGRMFWDTTLAIPVWYDGAAAVWVNSAGAPV